jgi:hypothetical protein
MEAIDRRLYNLFIAPYHGNKAGKTLEQRKIVSKKKKRVKIAKAKN